MLLRDKGSPAYWPRTGQETARLTADVRPCRPSSMSKLTVWPSFNVGSPGVTKVMRFERELVLVIEKLM